MNTLVRRANESDIAAIAGVHGDAFPRQLDSKEWVRATLAAYPRMLAYVLIHDAQLAGFVFWAQVSGFRRNAIVELDQLAVLSKLRGQGFGERLIEESLALVKSQLDANQQTVKALLAKTASDNKAQQLYGRVLGVKPVAEIDGLFAKPEIVMVAQIAEE